jgi:hypothetical protein
MMVVSGLFGRMPGRGRINDRDRGVTICLPFYRDCVDLKGIMMKEADDRVTATVTVTEWRTMVKVAVTI